MVTYTVSAGVDQFIELIKSHYLMLDCAAFVRCNVAILINTLNVMKAVVYTELTLKSTTMDIHEQLHMAATCR